MYEGDSRETGGSVRSPRVRRLHRDDGMRPRSSIACRFALALAVLCATSGPARRVMAKPPAWEPGCSPVPLSCMAGKGALKLDLARRTLSWKWTVAGLVGISSIE